MFVSKRDHDTWDLRDKLTKPHDLGLVEHVHNMEGCHSIDESIAAINGTEVAVMNHLIKGSSNQLQRKEITCNTSTTDTVRAFYETCIFTVASPLVLTLYSSSSCS